MHRTATLMAEEKNKPSPDKTRIAELQKQFDRALNEAPDAPHDASEKQAFVQHFHDMAQDSNCSIAL